MFRPFLITSLSTLTIIIVVLDLSARIHLDVSTFPRTRAPHELRDVARSLGLHVWTTTNLLQFIALIAVYIAIHLFNLKTNPVFKAHSDALPFEYVEEVSGIEIREQVMLGLFKGVSRAASFVHGLVVTGAMAEAVESCIDEIIVAGDAALQEVEAKMYPGGAGDRRKISVE